MMKNLIFMFSFLFVVVSPALAQEDSMDRFFKSLEEEVLHMIDPSTPATPREMLSRIIINKNTYIESDKKVDVFQLTQALTDEEEKLLENFTSKKYSQSTCRKAKAIVDSKIISGHLDVRVEVTNSSDYFSVKACAKEFLRKLKKEILENKKLIEGHGDSKKLPLSPFEKSNSSSVRDI